MCKAGPTHESPEMGDFGDGALPSALLRSAREPCMGALLTEYTESDLRLHKHNTRLPPRHRLVAAKTVSRRSLWQEQAGETHLTPPSPAAPKTPCSSTISCGLSTEISTPSSSLSGRLMNPIWCCLSLSRRGAASESWRWWRRKGEREHKRSSRVDAYLQRNHL